MNDKDEGKEGKTVGLHHYSQDEMITILENHIQFFESLIAEKNKTETEAENEK